MTSATTTVGARERNRLRTRQRIVEAAMELHTTVGPARTTVLGIAERAGVQRHTVYAHFPDETAIFRACTAHWFALNPPPDHEGWAAVASFDDRVETAIGDVYAYWERTAGDLIPVLADAGRVEAMAEAMTFWRERTQTWIDTAVGDHRLRGARGTRMRAALRHAFAIETWRSLTAPGGLSRPEAVRLMADMVRVAAEPRRRGATRS